MGVGEQDVTRPQHARERSVKWAARDRVRWNVQSRACSLCCFALLLVYASLYDTIFVYLSSPIYLNTPITNGGLAIQQQKSRP